MARENGPQCKQCRREGQKLFLKGERCLTDKCGVERRAYPPGDHGRGRQKRCALPAMEIQQRRPVTRASASWVARRCAPAASRP